MVCLPCFDTRAHRRLSAIHRLYAISKLPRLKVLDFKKVKQKVRTVLTACSSPAVPCFLWRGQERSMCLPPSAGCPSRMPKRDRPQNSAFAVLKDHNDCGIPRTVPPAVPAVPRPSLQYNDASRTRPMTQYPTCLYMPHPHLSRTCLAVPTRASRH